MAIKKINELSAATNPMPDDYLVIDNGISTERVKLADLKTFFSTTSTPTPTATPPATPTPTTTKTLSATPTPTPSITPSTTPSAPPPQVDRAFYDGSNFVLRKSWENTTTAVDSKITLASDGLENVNSGAIVYHQSTSSDRRSYITSDGHNGNRAIKFVLSPYPPDGTKTSIQTWNSGHGFGVGSGSTYNAVEGSEIWARVWIKLSANWSWDPVAYNQSYSTLKMFRVYPFNTYQGELIVQVDTGHGYTGYAGRICAFTQGFTGGNISLYGGPGGDCAGNPGAAADMPLNTWFAIDTYMKISATPATAKVIIWRDGVKILEKTGGSTYQTLNRSGTTELLTSPGLILFSTWDVNGNQDGPTLPNGEQSIIYDDIIVTNNRAWVEANGTQDGSGNWLIGTSV